MALYEHKLDILCHIKYQDSDKKKKSLADPGTFVCSLFPRFVFHNCDVCESTIII